MANGGQITVKLDKAHLTARFRKGKEHIGPILCEQILSDCNQYSVPDDGENILKSSGRVERDGEDFAVTWNTVYAAYQFYGCWPDGSHQIRNHTQGYTTNPSTQWTEAARARYGSDWQTVAQREFVKGAGG